MLVIALAQLSLSWAYYSYEHISWPGKQPMGFLICFVFGGWIAFTHSAWKELGDFLSSQEVRATDVPHGAATAEWGPPFILVESLLPLRSPHTLFSKAVETSEEPKDRLWVAEFPVWWPNKLLADVWMSIQKPSSKEAYRACDSFKGTYYCARY